MGARARRLAPLVAIVPAIIAMGLGAAPAAAQDPADQPPFGGEPIPELERPDSAVRPPPGYGLSAREATAIADRTEAVREERAESPGMRPRAFTRGPDRWQVSYFDDGVEVAQVVIADAEARVIEAFRDHQVEVRLARGYQGAVAGKVSKPYIWLPLCLLFLLPFVDPKRPFRLLHLDLLVLLGFGVSQFFFNRGEIVVSVPLVYPVLAYLFVRMLIAGLRPREHPGPLLPLAPVRWLAIAAVALVAFRIAVNVSEPKVIDIGFAGVVGAERIAGGEAIYDGEFTPLIDRGDSYGPLNYLAYVPFELALPWDGVWDDLPAAHAFAIFFDLLTAGGLFLLGRRLREGAAGRTLGVALAFAWLAYPYTLYALAANTNDALVSALLVGALLVLTSAPARGALAALGAAAKFGPLAIAPLLAAGTGERRWRSVIPFGLAFVAVWALVLLPLLPDGGPREFYDRTLGYQASRGSPFSIWGLEPSLDTLQTLVRAFAVVLGLALFLYPRRRGPIQIAALGAAVLIATQVGATHWFYFFIAWFAPYVLVVLFASQARIGRRPQADSQAESRVATRLP